MLGVLLAIINQLYAMIYNNKIEQFKDTVKLQLKIKQDPLDHIHQSPQLKIHLFSLISRDYTMQIPWTQQPWKEVKTYQIDKKSAVPISSHYYYVTIEFVPSKLIHNNNETYFVAAYSRENKTYFANPLFYSLIGLHPVIRSINYEKEFESEKQKTGELYISDISDDDYTFYTWIKSGLKARYQWLIIGCLVVIYIIRNLYLSCTRIDDRDSKNNEVLQL